MPSNVRERISVESVSKPSLGSSIPPLILTSAEPTLAGINGFFTYLESRCLCWVPIIIFLCLLLVLFWMPPFDCKKKPSYDWILISSPPSVENSYSLPKGFSLVDSWIFSFIYSSEALAFWTVSVSRTLLFRRRSSFALVSSPSIICWFLLNLFPVGNYVMFL